MSYKVLALKWRPRSFDAVIGQQATLLALQHALNNNQVHHAYLFTGTRGVGKTSIARILAKCLNCEQGVSAQPCGVCSMCIAIDQGDCVDVIEVDAASRTKVEDTRDLLDNMPYAPVNARFKIYIIDEVHMLSNHSFNALLKTLEEPPAHVKFILATTDPQKLPVTVLSRCLQFHLRNFTVEQIVQQLNKILTQEAINFEAAALVTIAQCANGSMRDALSLLEQVVAFGERQVTQVAAQQILGTAVHQQILNLLTQIIRVDARQVITIVRDMAANNVDFNQALKVLQTLIYQLSLLQILPDSLTESAFDLLQLQNLALNVDAVDLQIFYQATLHGVRDLPYAPDVVVGFEMIVLRMLAFQPVHVEQAKPRAETVLMAKATEQPLVVETPKATAAISQPAPQIRQPAAIAVVQSVMPSPVAPNLMAMATVSSQAATTGSPVWADIVPQLNLPGLTKVIAENSTLDLWSVDHIKLTLHESQRTLLNPKHTERIQDALQKLYKNKVKVSVIVGTVQSETPAIQGRKIQQAVQSAAEAEINSDKHIQQFTQTFAATIEQIESNVK